MIVETDNDFAFEVTFSPLDRESGFDDDIRIAIRESGSKTTRLLRADQCNVMLTPDQAEQLGEALLQAAHASRAAK